MRGRHGVLHTGHCVIDTHREVWLGRSAATQVRFAHVTDEEIEAYVATGEPPPSPAPSPSTASAERSSPA